MEQNFEVVCQAISVTKNGSAVRLAVPSEDPKKPGALIVFSAITEEAAKQLSTNKKYQVTITEIAE